MGILPLLTDTLFALCVKDPDAALALLPTLQESPIWNDIGTCNPRCAASLRELEWYLGLHQRHQAWSAASDKSEEELKAGLPRLVGFGPGAHIQVGNSTDAAVIKAEQAQSNARDA